jgi:UDPglucose 6-dehydrogenase
MKSKIGIIGVGVVGKALAEYYSSQKLSLYDKYQNLGSMEAVNSADIIFVCVPTPYDENKNGFDLSHVRDAISRIREGKTVVIKSTIVPGTTEKLQGEFKNLKLLYSPEFLVAKTAIHDVFSPDRSIVGYTKESFRVAGEVMNVLPMAPYEKIMPATEAEMVKYFGNTWFAVKIIFSNQIFDICSALDIDYNRVVEAAMSDKRIGRTHMDVFCDEYRGYGGQCLPKDIRALIQRADELGVDLPLLKKTEEINNFLRRKIPG